MQHTPAEGSASIFSRAESSDGAWSREEEELFAEGAPPMSMFCSCFSRRRSNNAERLYLDQFASIRDAFPGTHYACLLNSETGEMIAQTEIPALNAEDLARTIITLKRAAMQFATTLNQLDSQVVHVKGVDRMFSCYGGDRTILAFFTQMPALDLELLDCSEGDKAVEMILSELNRIAYTTNAIRKPPRY